jgi:2-keto-4-pentenoate hydratase
MMPSFDELVVHMDRPGIDAHPDWDITKIKPEITQQEALAVQIGVKRRRASAGDAIFGHQASFTSKNVQRLFPGAPVPMVGTLLKSLIRESGDLVELDCPSVVVESEIGVILKRDLEGPHPAHSEITAAIEGFVPAIEIAPLRSGVMEGKFSWPHMIGVQKAVGGFVILGRQITSPKGFDPRLEGCIVSMNGEAKAGAVGFEAMGGPISVIRATAAKLHEVGEKLHAGQVVITGSLPPPQEIGKSDSSALVEFQTLGQVSVRFARSHL